VIPTRLEQHLKQTGVAYTPVVHVPARSAQYAAAVMHIAGKEMAKTVVLRSGSKILLAVLPASYHVNLAEMSKATGTPVKIVDEPECYTLFPDCQPGAVPPFGELYGYPVYLDESLAEDPEIIFNAGTLSDAVRMGNADFVHLTKPRVCSFAEKGETTTRAAAAAKSIDEGGEA
jgi:Ala-tRNA(Pro) deacylase